MQESENTGKNAQASGGRRPVGTDQKTLLLRLIFFCVGGLMGAWLLGSLIYMFYDAYRFGLTNTEIVVKNWKIYVSYLVIIGIWALMERIDGKRSENHGEKGN
ncbi:MAG: hypothetical protein GY757_53700 [bacterium]|nr:hypothetical protein [bacterium]